jgi:signal transduction histidine kinase
MNVLQSRIENYGSASDSALTGASRFARKIDFRSGGVIAVSRIVLAGVFFLALWLDPSQPVRASGWGYALLIAYFSAAAGLVLVAWRSWWWDHRLAWPALALDLIVFLAAVFFTEGESDFTSPFLAFFAFLLLAATIRWDWRVTALVGALATGLYLGVGLAMTAGGIEFDLYRFTRRVIYMLILSMVVVWFGLQRRERQIDRFRGDEGSGGEIAGLLDAAMDYAIAQCGATGATIAWAEDEEPWAHLRAKGGAASAIRVGPEEFDASAHSGRPARLFDRDRQRQLRGGAGGRPVAVSGPVDEPLARLLGVSEALALPLTGSAGSGEILLTGMRGATADHVQIGEQLAREIEAAFDRFAMTSLVRSAAIAHTRDAVARDLHDSVAQALAGASFRLEALRHWIDAGKDPEPEIASIQQALRSEQQHVRGLIARLRAGGEPRGEADLSVALAALAGDLSRQWGVEVETHGSEAPVLVPDWLSQEVQQLMREALANAVRHGAAARITFALARADDGLHLAITDDGRGFPMDKGQLKPWSLHERVKSLGGTMALVSGDGGTRIEIVLPMEADR